MKMDILEILELDNRFSDSHAEKIIKDISHNKKWKKPDVQTNYNGEKFVFEIQLSTTFLSVIVSRDIFYKRNEINLIWIFNTFDPYDSKFTERDVFYNNNCNALVFDDECYEISKMKKLLHIKVHYQKVLSLSQKVISTEIVDFSKLKFKKNMVYIYDHDRELRIIKYNFSKKEFFNFIRLNEGQKMNIDEFNKWLIHFEQFNMQNWQTERYDKYNLMYLFRVLVSIQDGKIYGWRFKNLVEVLNHIFRTKRYLFKSIYDFTTNGNYWENIHKVDKKRTIKKILKEFLNDDYTYETKYDKYLHWFFNEFNNVSV